MRTRILIAGKRAHSRSALRIFLESGHGLEVVGEAADSEELLAEVSRKHPNLLLLEWGLAGQPAKQLLRALRSLNSRLTVIVLGGRPELEQAALTAGAEAFFNLADPPKRLLALVQAVEADTRSE